MSSYERIIGVAFRHEDQGVYSLHYPRLKDHAGNGIMPMFRPEPSRHSTQIFSEDLW